VMLRRSARQARPSPEMPLEGEPNGSPFSLALITSVHADGDGRETARSQPRKTPELYAAESAVGWIAGDDT
jgi:hypothetical protein